MCEMPDASESKVVRVRPSIRPSVRPSGSFFRTELVLGARQGKQSIGASEEGLEMSNIVGVMGS